MSVKCLLCGCVQGRVAYHEPDCPTREMTERGQKKLENDALDREVYARIPADGEADPVRLVSLVGSLCKVGSHHERDIDRSLQRLRKGRAIWFFGGGWTRVPDKASGPLGGAGGGQ